MSQIRIIVLDRVVKYGGIVMNQIMNIILGTIT